MLFKKEQITIRNLQKKDHTLLAKWLSDPLVLEFYEGRDNPFDAEKVNQTFYNYKDDVVRCIFAYEEFDIGYIQYYPIDEEIREIGHYADTEVVDEIDQFIGETDYWNRGIGTLLIKSMVTFLQEQKQVDIIVMDPQTWNKRAIRCYEKCHFRKIHLLPQHEFHEGKYQDCWLIEYRK